MIENLKKEFEKKYFTNISTTKGTEMLAESIGISKNSLRRFLGRMNDTKQIRTSTLNMIADKLGYKSFQDFCENSNNSIYSIDFDTLEIYYKTVKGKGVKVSQNDFQKANYYFSEKIVSNQDNLEKFLKRFDDNAEALEYVLGWHPYYSRITKKDYQDALFRLAKISPNFHIKVYSNSFIYFGKFMAENWEASEAEKHIDRLKKLVKQMRFESHFWTFPEARFTVALCLHAFLTKTDYEKEIQKILSENSPKKASFGDQLIYTIFVSDALNVLKLYDLADKYQEKIFDDFAKIKRFQNENPNLKFNVILGKIVRSITLFKIGKELQSKTIFDEITLILNTFPPITFEIKDYLELQYFWLARKFYPENVSFSEKFDSLIVKTGLIFYRKI